MSLCPACFVASTFDQSDWLKLLGIAGTMVALYVIAKRMGRGDEAVPPPSEIPIPVESQTTQTMETPDAEEPHVEDLGQVQDLDQVDYEPKVKEELEKPQPRKIRITNWNFEQFDISSGPPNPNIFADNLWMELHDASSGHAWKQTRFVATPAGLEKMLRANKWSSMAVPQTLVMTRYDLRELRGAILDELGAIEANRGDVPPDASDDAALGQ